MNVSPNIIRFPVPAASPVRQTEMLGRQDNVVVFPKTEETFTDNTAAGFGSQLQEFGQLFAAHRIVGRVADELEAVAAL